MAEGKNNKELKALAIANLAASRAEISTDLSRLRHDLDPKRIMHHIVDGHKTAMIGAAATAGLIVVLIVYRQLHTPKRSHARYERRSSVPVKVGPGILRILAQAFMPILIKSALNPGLIHSLMAKRHNVSGKSGVNADGRY